MLVFGVRAVADDDDSTGTAAAGWPDPESDLRSWWPHELRLDDETTLRRSIFPADTQQPGLLAKAAWSSPTGLLQVFSVFQIARGALSLHVLIVVEDGAPAPDDVDAIARAIFPELSTIDVREPHDNPCAVQIIGRPLGQAAPDEEPL